MISRFLFTVTFVMALGCGLIAGLFFAFGVVVTQALPLAFLRLRACRRCKLSSAPFGPLFLVVFLGTGAGVLVMVTALLHWQSPSPCTSSSVARSIWLEASGLTIVCNVPRTTHSHRWHRLTPTARACGTVTFAV